MPLKAISIIIPCYNSGAFLPDAIKSVKEYTGVHSYEIIVVDDGSTDKATLELLENLSKQNCTVIHQTNKGPAAARNTGIKNADSEFILFLDSDNMIFPKYIDKGIEILKASAEIGVVYGNAEFFGEESRIQFEGKPFDIQSVLAWNYVDMCAVIRRSAWEQVGGLDEKRELMGHEDWEFWINIYKHGWKFVYLDEKLFKYRIRAGSLITETSQSVLQKKIQYIYSKHSDLINQQYLIASADSITYKKDIQRPLRSFFKYLRIKYLKQNKN